MNRKADLSLSVNAIVILVLAIVIMAFALPFVNKMFKKTTTEFEALSGEEPSAPVANGANPITLSRNNLIMSVGDKKAIKASVFNTHNYDTATSRLFTPSLPNNPILSVTCPLIIISDQSTPTIKENEAKEVILIIQAKNVPDTKICTFNTHNDVGGNSISIPVTIK